jgi:hypothetical protein
MSRFSTNSQKCFNFDFSGSIDERHRGGPDQNVENVGVAHQEQQGQTAADVDERRSQTPPESGEEEWSAGTGNAEAGRRFRFAREAKVRYRYRGDEVGPEHDAHR